MTWNDSNDETYVAYAMPFRNIQHVRAFYINSRIKYLHLKYFMYIKKDSKIAWHSRAITTYFPLSSRARQPPFQPARRNLDSPTRCSFQVFLPPSLRLLINDRAPLRVPSSSRESRVGAQLVEGEGDTRLIVSLQRPAGLSRSHPDLIYRASLLIEHGRTLYDPEDERILLCVRRFHFFSGEL